MADYAVPKHDESLNLVYFFGSLISKQKYTELMQDEDERAAYLDYLRG